MPVEPLTLMVLVVLLYYLLQKVLDNRHTRQMAEIELRMAENRTRQLEQFNALDEPTQQRLLETMPEWLDPEDIADVEAWKKARQEAILVGKRKPRKQE